MFKKGHRSGWIHRTSKIIYTYSNALDCLKFKSFRRNRLWSLLSEERSIRFEVQNKALQLNKERSDQPKAKSDEENKNVEIYTEIDTSPITSPENIRQTR